MLINDLVVALCAALHQHFGALLGDQTKQQLSQPGLYDATRYGLVAVPCRCWALSRCASNMSCTIIRCNRYGVWAPAPAPNSEADFLLLHRVLSTGQGGQDLVRGARNPPLARPCARNAAPSARLIGKARARRPPPTSHARLALHSRPLPTGAGIDVPPSGGKADADADAADADAV